MGSLKEIKSRINSVKSTQKITSAMKMVSSSKLIKAQRNIENFYPYQQKIESILRNLLASGNDEFDSIYAEKREIKRVAIVVFASNSSLCGSFNANVAKKLTEALKSFQHLGSENILLFPVGKQIAKVCRKSTYKILGDFDHLADKPNYFDSLHLSDMLMSSFENEEFDKVVLIYNHFKSKSTQELTIENLLPINTESTSKSSYSADYIIEPNPQKVIEQLMPKAIRLKLHTALLDSIASEHAARTIAMQIATENADDILQELSMQYNKSRQQAITNELLDIIGGSFA